MSGMVATRPLRPQPSDCSANSWNWARPQHPHPRGVPDGGVLVGELGHEVAVLQRAVHPDDRQQYGAADACPGGRRAQPFGDRAEERGGPVLFDRRRVRHVDDGVGAGQRGVDPVGGPVQQIHTRGPGQLGYLVTGLAGGDAQLAADEPGRTGDGDTHDTLLTPTIVIRVGRYPISRTTSIRVPVGC
jgi:hypothetical protein